ncbi:ChaB family protein [Salmonella enterica subsp. enterica]|nr:ChaB family protein [Salmonella enterica subsp. enterica]
MKPKSDLPDNVRNVLPAHAQDIYKEAFAFNDAGQYIKDKTSRRDDIVARKPHTSRTGGG